MLQILGGHRVAVGEPRGGIDAKGDRRLVRRDADLVGHEAVDGPWLVTGANGERLEHERGEARRGLSLDRERIELVEARATVRIGDLQRAALGRIGVDEVECNEAPRVFRLLAIGCIRVGLVRARGVDARDCGTVGPRRRRSGAIGRQRRRREQREHAGGEQRCEAAAASHGGRTATVRQYHRRAFKHRRVRPRRASFASTPAGR